MNEQECIAAIDIGTTKICAIVARINEHGKVEILGVGRSESLGVMRGEVANIEKTIQSIIKAVEEANQQSKFIIKDVYVGIAGHHIKSLQHRGILTRENNSIVITRTDINRLIEDMHRLVLQPGDKIIHVLPQEFIIDNEPGIKDPIGHSGARLEANFHIITGRISAAQNINRCVIQSGLIVNDLILEPLASAASVLSDEEKEAGVALVDIGGGTTDLAIFQDGIIRHTAVIPFAGNIITEDIKEGLMIMKQQAELLKMRFGSALAVETKENISVTIPGLKGRPPKEISLRNLASIIQARMEEILEQVYFEIRRSGFEKKLIGGIVLTGGGSQLRHLPQLVELITGMDARVGYPTEHIAKTVNDEIKNPMYATAVGLIIKGHEDRLSKRYNSAVKEEVLQEEVNENEERFIEPPRRKWWNLDSLLEKGKTWLSEDLKNDFK